MFFQLHENQVDASIVSAVKTPTNVIFGKSSPFAIICVPSKISAFSFPNALIIFHAIPLRLVVSTSIRITRASGNTFVISSSTFCVPVPKKRICSLLHSGHSAGTFPHDHNNDILNDGSFCDMLTKYHNADIVRHTHNHDTSQTKNDPFYLKREPFVLFFLIDLLFFHAVPLKTSNDFHPKLFTHINNFYSRQMLVYSFVFSL